MSVSVKNEFVNLGVASRVSHVLLAKVVAFATAYGSVIFAGLVASGWFMVPMVLMAYLLITGLVGWDPIAALDNHIKGLCSNQTGDVAMVAVAH